MPREHRTPPSDATEPELLARARRIRGGSVLDLSGVHSSLFRKESTGFYLLHARVLSPTLIEHLAVLSELARRHLPIPPHLMRADAELVLVRGEWVLRGANPRTAGRRILYVYRRWVDAPDDDEGNFRSYSGKVIGTVSTSRQVFGPADYMQTSLISSEEVTVERDDEDADL